MATPDCGGVPRPEIVSLPPRAIAPVPLRSCLPASALRVANSPALLPLKILTAPQSPETLTAPRPPGKSAQSGHKSANLPEYRPLIKSRATQSCYRRGHLAMVATFGLLSWTLAQGGKRDECVVSWDSC